MAGLAAGLAFIRAAHARLQAAEDVQFAALRGGGARKSLLMLAVMTAHAFGEGAGVGVSFAGRRGWAEGAAVCAAIAVHNIPEGLSVATVLVAAGVPARSAAFWAVATHLPQALVALPAFLFVSSFTRLLPAACGFAAGCMLWMALAELLPDSLAGLAAGDAATVATCAATLLEAFRLACAWLQDTPNAAGVLSAPLVVALAGAALLGPAVGALVASASRAPLREPLTARRSLVAASFGAFVSLAVLRLARGGLAGLPAALCGAVAFICARAVVVTPHTAVPPDAGELPLATPDLNLGAPVDLVLPPAIASTLLLCASLCWETAVEGAACTAAVRGGGLLPAAAFASYAPDAALIGATSALAALACGCSPPVATAAAVATSVAHVTASLVGLAGPSESDRALSSQAAASAVRGWKVGSSRARPCADVR